MPEDAALENSVDVAASSPARHTRIDRLDGIRTLAVLLVFLLHASVFNAGWIGVWLFFALSGMLITGILRRDRNSTLFWGPFYIKRATRILPPLVIAFAIAAAFFAIPWHRVAVPYLFFGANFSLAFRRDDAHGLIVLWSLAIEEQFYLLWPFAIRFLSRGHLIRLLIAILILEPVARGLCTPFFPDYWTIYTVTPFQIDGLSAGALLALLLEDESVRQRLRRWSGPVFACGLLVYFALSMVPGFQRDANTRAYNTFGYSILVLASTAFLSYILLREDSILSRLLSLRVLTFVGTMSYGLYLFHLSLMELTRRWGGQLGFHHPEQLSVLSIVPSLLLSWASFRFYEKPITVWGRRMANRWQAARLGARPARP